MTFPLLVFLTDLKRKGKTVNWKIIRERNGTKMKAGPRETTMWLENKLVLENMNIALTSLLNLKGQICRGHPHPHKWVPTEWQTLLGISSWRSLSQTYQHLWELSKTAPAPWEKTDLQGIALAFQTQIPSSASWDTTTTTITWFALTSRELCVKLGWDQVRN